jgi:protein-L-isoaspartate(D-aspartate) O-methyltransferase
MVERQLAARGIHDPRVLAAMGQVRREEFVPPARAGLAYADQPLAIGHGQTISQPYIVAMMAQALRVTSGDRALEIGTGSGYGAAVLAHLAREVYTVERNPELAAEASARLARLGHANVRVHCGDGSLGWKEHAPYDVISVTAGGPALPPTLLDQLAIGGRLVMPVGPEGMQRLVRATRTGTVEYAVTDLGGVQFVPLIGAEGWSPAPS